MRLLEWANSWGQRTRVVVRAWEREVGSGCLMDTNTIYRMKKVLEMGCTYLTTQLHLKMVR